MAETSATAATIRPAASQISPARRYVTLFLFLLVAALSYIDRQVFTLFQDDVKAELALSDGQLGLLTGLAFGLFYAAAAFPIARYADRGDRRLVISASVIVWSIATVACGFAMTFWQMLAARIGLAAGEAGAGPAANSLLVEIFPKERRVIVLGSMLAASSVGLAGGLALAGWLSLYFDWRSVFLIVGFPGVILGLLVWFFASEPRRLKGAEKGTITPIRAGVVIRTMLSSTSLRWVGVLMISGPMAGFAFILWGASFFRRVHDMPVEQVGFWLGGAMALGLVISNLLAGYIGDKYGTKNPRFNSVLGAASLAASFPCAMLFCFAKDANVALAAFVAVKFLMALYLGPMIALCFAQVPVAMRAVMSATINLFIGVFGTGIGGTLAGYLSGLFTPIYGDEGLRYALAITSLGLIVSAFAALMAGRTAIVLDEEEA